MQCGNSPHGARGLAQNPALRPRVTIEIDRGDPYSVGSHGTVVVLWPRRARTEGRTHGTGAVPWLADPGVKLIFRERGTEPNGRSQKGGQGHETKFDAICGNPNALAGGGLDQRGSAEVGVRCPPLRFLALEH